MIDEVGNLRRAFPGGDDPYGNDDPWAARDVPDLNALSISGECAEKNRVHGCQKGWGTWAVRLVLVGISDYLYFPRESD